MKDLQGINTITSEANTPEDLANLSRKKLAELITEQRKQLAELRGKIDDLTNPPPNDWHSWFYALLHIVLFKFQMVDIQREVVLGAHPPMKSLLRFYAAQSP